jgi:hypothetical protein
MVPFSDSRQEKGTGENLTKASSVCRRGGVIIGALKLILTPPLLQTEEAGL